MMQQNDRVAFAQRYIGNLCEVLQHLPFEKLAAAMEILEQAQSECRHIFLAGNGGSAATSSHMANDLVKVLARDGRRGMGAIALTDSVPLITSIANDDGYDEVFSRQLSELGKAGDVLIVFSASGKSPNIIRVVSQALQMGIKTIAFLGMGGGHVAAMADVSVIVPSDSYGPVEDAHLVFDHLITDYLRARLTQPRMIPS
jgi:D-sedoheptulose 7-phosphate isomerase